MDKGRKLMTMHNALHPGDDKNILDVSRKEGREHTNIEDYIDASIQELEDDIKKNKKD